MEGNKYKKISFTHHINTGEIATDNVIVVVPKNVHVNRLLQNVTTARDTV